jgi:Domain of unknown function (DUF4440)
MYLKTLVLCLMGIVLFAMPALAQSKDEIDVAQAVATLKQAMIDADKTVLEKIVANELSYGHSGGSVEDKAMFIESLTSGKSDFVTIDLSEQTIKIVGKTALVRHKLSAETNNRGVAGSVKLAILLVWQKQGGSWKLLARQAVKL